MNRDTNNGEVWVGKQYYNAQEPSYSRNKKIYNYAYLLYDGHKITENHYYNTPHWHV